MDLEAYRALPIPLWLDLDCPKCAYPLRGLPEHRCPECGGEFNIDDLVAPHVPLRPPEITARTRPVPDLGFTCRKCDYPLKGLPGDRCPECGEPFNLTDFIPPQPWGEVVGSTSYTETMAVFSYLRSLGIPCRLLDTQGPPGARGADVIVGENRKVLHVRRDYYLDALAAIIAAPSQAGMPWICPHCREEVPGNFEVCWKCQCPKGS